MFDSAPILAESRWDASWAVLRQAPLHAKQESFYLVDTETQGITHSLHDELQGSLSGNSPREELSFLFCVEILAQRYQSLV